MTAFFAGVPATDYAINRTIDRTVRAFSWDDLDALLQQARIPRRNWLMQVARQTVRQAQASRPALLDQAPENTRQAVKERLEGDVRIAY